MKLILLSGLDGTGNLFAPFIEALPKSIETQVISYPKDERLGYQELIELVNRHLPKEEEYVLLAESFSGYIAYSVALQKPKNLKAVVFVATFLENPRPILSKFLPIVPLQFMLSLPMPSMISSSIKKIIFIIVNDSPLMEEIKAQKVALSQFFEVELVEK